MQVNGGSGGPTVCASAWRAPGSILALMRCSQRLSRAPSPCPRGRRYVPQGRRFTNFHYYYVWAVAVALRLAVFRCLSETAFRLEKYSPKIGQ